MAQNSKIEWTDATWNPIVGCSIVSPGCSNCYAMKMAARIESMRTAPHYSGITKKVNGKSVWTGKVALAPDHILTAPLRTKRPTTWFVNSMSDLFHEDVSADAIDRVFSVMNMCPQHTFQVLTKRPNVMRQYFHDRRDGDPWAEAADAIAYVLGKEDHPAVLEPKDIPHPNIWLGTSVERQKEADERIVHLIKTPAFVRFLSCEPLLGPIDLTPWINDINWVIVGGESGPNARPMHPDWARSIRDQCINAGVPFHFKQWGRWKHGSDFRKDAEIVAYDGRSFPHMSAEIMRSNPPPQQLEMMAPVGKHKSGRELDGCIWDEFPLAIP